MADLTFMYTIVAGVFARIVALLFTARAKRYRGGFKPITKEERSWCSVN